MSSIEEIVKDEKIIGVSKYIPVYFNNPNSVIEKSRQYGTFDGCTDLKDNYTIKNFFTLDKNNISAVYLRAELNKFLSLNIDLNKYLKLCREYYSQNKTRIDAGLAYYIFLSTIIKGNRDEFLLEAKDLCKFDFTYGYSFRDFKNSPARMIYEEIQKSKKIENELRKEKSSPNSNYGRELEASLKKQTEKIENLQTLLELIH